MMIRTILVTLCMLTAWPAIAQEKDFLTDQNLFSEAWEELQVKIGEKADLVKMRLSPSRIEVQLRSIKGGPRVDSWKVERQRGLLGFGMRNVISGPSPVAMTGPVADVESGFFSSSELPLHRLVAILSEAKSLVKLLDPGHVSSVEIARRISLIPQPSFADARWQIVVANDREQATVSAKIDGTIFGVDISGTHRGRNRNFLTQTDWPLGEAFAGFRNIIKQGVDVYEVNVRRNSISVDAVSDKNPELKTTWSWDGGKFTRGLVDTYNFNLTKSGGNLPFPIDDVDLEALPKVLAAARAEAPSEYNIRSVNALKEPVVSGNPEVLWRVTLSKAPTQILSNGKEDTIVRLRMDGSVVSVILPKSLRPALEFTDGPALVAAVSKFKSTLGEAAPVFELMFRPKKADMLWLDPDKPDQATEIWFDGDALSSGFSRPLMMETEADLFALESIVSLDAGVISAIRKKAVAAIAIPKGEVYRLRIWSGSPFWRSKDGKPLIDVRVGVPPKFNQSGYAVFRLDGTLVEVVK